VSDEPVFGFLNIDKPLGITSHDVIAKTRRAFGIRKVGHAGTLDPLATGVLVVCLGNATRLSEYVMRSTKRYTAQVHFGVSTTTYDTEGEVTAERPAEHLIESDIRAAFGAFTGEILQTPPLYSAIKQGGRKLYEIARAGETATLEARPVTIHQINLLDWQPPIATLDVLCNAGTYIRSLAHDLGERLGAGAHLAGLIRTQSGHFRLPEARPLDEVLEDPRWRGSLISPAAALSEWRRVTLDARQAEIVGHGGAIPLHEGAERELALAFAPQGRLLAVVRAEEGAWVPQKVFWRN
jgi:tRNA pseudouridine55 synthase